MVLQGRVSQHIQKLEACGEQAAGHNVGQAAHDDIADVVVLFAELVKLLGVDGGYPAAQDGARRGSALAHYRGHTRPTDDIQRLGSKDADLAVRRHKDLNRDLTFQDDVKKIVFFPFGEKVFAGFDFAQRGDFHQPFQAFVIELEEPGDRL